MDAVCVVAGGLELDHSSLRRILGHAKWRLYETTTCGETLALVRRRAIPVVISERNLPDGNWKTLLEGLGDLPWQPRLIVFSRLADHLLWAEVLNLGGYDVLATPFDREEVLRVGQGGVALLKTGTGADHRLRYRGVISPPSLSCSVTAERGKRVA